MQIYTPMYNKNQILDFEFNRSLLSCRLSSYLYLQARQPRFIKLHGVQADLNVFVFFLPNSV